MSEKEIEQEDFFIDALDPGIRLHVREKWPRRMGRSEAASTLLLVHGRGAPGPVAFDLQVPSYSWMDYFAARGFDVFTLSIRGFGRSTHPPEILEDPAGKPPALRGRTAVRDIEAVVNFICERRQVDQLNILGRSWGTTTSPAFAADHPDRVRKLVLYAPYYAYPNPERAAQFEDPARPGEWDNRRGAWFWTTEEDHHKRWWGHIPGDAHHAWREEHVVRAFWEARVQDDPEGARRNPPAVRSPNGSLADLYDRCRNIPLYDAAKIRCPVLLVFGDQDGSANEPEAWSFFQKLTESHGRRLVIFSDGTHFMEFEKRREELFREVQIFLET